MSAIFLPANMHIRNGTYHYRRRIPSDLVSLFGRKEITKSLHTQKPLDAVRLKNRLDVQLEQLFLACRMESITSESALSRLHSILYGSPQPQASLTTQTAAPIVIIPSRRRGKRLSDAIEAYCKEHQNGWTTKTSKEFSGIHDKLLKGLSDPWLQDIDRPALVEYRDKLSLEGKHTKTVNKYLQILSTVLRHAGRLKWITGNPAEGLGLRDTRREDEIKPPFSSEEIKKVFLAIQAEKKYFYDNGHHERYWLPLLGMYTGARVNELAQLSTTDVIIDNGIPALKITSAGDDSKRLKSESARRTIPIHNDLLTLGFLVYVQNTRSSGHARLFPALKSGPNGYSHYFVSRHFSGKNGWLRKTIPDISEGVTFHSFRHTITTMLKNAEQPERLIEEILGHKHSSLAMGLYGKPYDLSIKAKAINRVSYGILPKLETVTTLQKVDENNLEEIECIKCGDFQVALNFEDTESPIEVRQYKRPDLHGYSLFHQAVASFMPD